MEPLSPGAVDLADTKESDMDFTYLIVILALITMLAVIVFALVSKEKVEQRMDDPDSTKSTLASDKRADGKPADV